MKRFLLASLCCLAVGAIGCVDSPLIIPTSGSSPSTPVAPPPPIPFETVYQGCGYIGPGHSTAIDNQADLDSLWADYFLDGSAPTIDFGARTVVVSRGPYRCGDCGILEVTSIMQTGSCTNVKLEWVVPCADCLELLKRPFHIISIPKTNTLFCFELNCAWSNPWCYECCGLPPPPCLI